MLEIWLQIFITTMEMVLVVNYESVVSVKAYLSSPPQCFSLLYESFPVVYRKEYSPATIYFYNI